MNRGAGSARVVTIAAVVLLLLVLSGLTWSRLLNTSGVRFRGAASRRPLAVALMQTARGSELITVDLSAMRVVRRIRLRSLALSIAAVPGERRVVTAQCGGPDRSADRAVGLYSPDTGDIDYVDLGVQNPLDVAATPEFALVVHGLERDGGLITSTVDLRGQARVKHGSVGEGALRPVSIGMRVLIPEAASSDERETSGEYVRLISKGWKGAGGESTTLTASWCSVVPVASRRARTLNLLVQRSSPTPDGFGKNGKSWSVVTRPIGLVAGAKRASEVPLPPLEHGSADACVWQGWLAIADADGIDMADPGDTVRIFDLSTGEQLMRLRIANGMPAAIEPWNERLLVVDGVSGDLFVFGRDGRIDRRIPLGGAPVGMADLAVIW